MPTIATAIHTAAQRLEGGGRLRNGLSALLYNVLPVLCDPATLRTLVRRYYARLYAADSGSGAVTPLHVLDDWEERVLRTYRICTGRLLILGAGYGREALPLAARGMQVLGIDADSLAVRGAARAAKRMRSAIAFLQADFLALPLTAECCDYIVISNSMYSAVPGAASRQAWLRGLAGLLRSGGLLIISFIPEHPARSPVKRFCTFVNGILARLPGTSVQYQRGDEAFNGHFLHAFQDEHELLAELTGTGLSVRELNWSAQYAVLTAPPTGEASVMDARPSAVPSAALCPAETHTR